MNGKRARALRIDAVQRYEAGESATRICSALGKSRKWLYKWLRRKEELSQVSSPKRAHNRTPIEMKEMVIEVRRKLQNTKYAQIGVNAINRKLYLQGLAPLSASTIKHILSREGLQRKKLPCVPKRTPCPKPQALCVNNMHQANIVGPHYIRGDARFYSLNVMYIATHRITINRSHSKDDGSIAEALIGTWKKLGIPDFLQMDNELSFRASNRYPQLPGYL